MNFSTVTRTMIRRKMRLEVNVVKEIGNTFHIRGSVNKSKLHVKKYTMQNYLFSYR